MCKRASAPGSVLVPGDEIPRHIAERREGWGFSPATENGSSLGALAPEGTWLQGLKAQLVGLAEAAGLNPRPSKAPVLEGPQHQIGTWSAAPRSN